MQPIVMSAAFFEYEGDYMRKINIQTFKQLGIQEKQALDCFDMPIAYATTVYSAEYYCYFCSHF